MVRLVLAVLLFGSMISLAGPVAAQDRTYSDAELAEARHSFDVATHAFETGDYETAVSEFRAALELSGAADLYFNIYLSEERAGNLAPAAEALDQYLSHGTLDDEQRGLLTGRLARLRARIASHTPAPAAEEPQVLLSSPIAQIAPAAAEPEATPRDDASPPVRVSESTPVAPFALFGVAGALLVSFGVFGGLSLAENDRLTSACGHGCSSAQVATLNTYDIVADVSWIGAAVVGVTGLVLLFVLPPERHEEPALALAPWFTPSGAGIAAGGSF